MHRSEYVIGDVFIIDKHGVQEPVLFMLSAMSQLATNLVFMSAMSHYLGRYKRPALIER